MSKIQPDGAVIRKVVERRDVPYERDAEGNIKTVPVEILECGHKVRQFDTRLRTGGGPVRSEGDESMGSAPSKERRCFTCEKRRDSDG